MTVIATSPALAADADRDHRRERPVQDQRAAARRLPRHVLLRRHHPRAQRHHVGIDKTTPVFQKINQAAGRRRDRARSRHRADDRSDVDHAGHHDRQELHARTSRSRAARSSRRSAPPPARRTTASASSFSGSSSLENQYFVDGVNTTGLTFGTVGTPVINDFIEEIEVITGGYNAEYGRATGGIVNVVTKTGSNEFKGSVFGYYQPGFLDRRRADARRSTRRRSTSTAEHRLQRRLRLRARRSDHQGQAVVLRRLRAAVQRDRLHAHDQAPDRLPHRSMRERQAVGAAIPTSDGAGRLRRRHARRRSEDRLLHHRQRSTPRSAAPTAQAYNVARQAQLRGDAGDQGQLTLAGAAAARATARASSASATQRHDSSSG